MSDGTVGELVAPLFHRHHDYLSTDCPRVLGSPLEGKIRHGSFLELKWLWASGHISHHPSHSVQLPRSFPNTCFFLIFYLFARRSFLFLHMQMLRRLKPPRSIFPPRRGLSVILWRRGSEHRPVATASVVVSTCCRDIIALV